MSKRAVSPRQLQTRRALLEQLEDRAVPAVFAVTTALDSIAVDLATGKDANNAISLRSAIMAANATSGADTITLPAGTYNLTIAGAGENAAATGDLDITDDLTINGGTAANTTVDAKSLDRVFQVTGNANVTLSALTIRGGLETQGGGIFNQGTLTLSNAIVSGNKVTGASAANATVEGANGGAGGSVSGAGIYNDVTGVLTLQGTTISTNTAQAGNGGNGAKGAAGTTNAHDGLNGGKGGDGGSAYGGGIYNFGGTVQLLGSSLISGNIVRAGNGGTGAAGGSGATGLAAAAGGKGGNGGVGGNGGYALGGGIYQTYQANGSNFLTGELSTIQQNSLTAGNGGNGGLGGNGGTAGSAAIAGNGGAGGNGGVGRFAKGGGIFNSGGTVDLNVATIVNQSVSSGKGGSGGSGGSGGNATQNAASVAGASGGNGGAGGTPGKSGDALGGGIHSDSGLVNVNLSLIAGNTVQSGPTQNAIIGGAGGPAGSAIASGNNIGVGGNGGNGGAAPTGGMAAGGAISLAAGTLGVYGSRLSQNQILASIGSYGGPGGNGGSGNGQGGSSSPGGDGGTAIGGGIAIFSGSAIVQLSQVKGNIVHAGPAGNGAFGSTNGPLFSTSGGNGGNGRSGANGGAGGSGEGGGIGMLKGSLNLSGSTFDSNSVFGAAGGTGGTGGTGTKSVFGPPGNGGNGALGGSGGLGGSGKGGGIAVIGGTTKISASTFVTNSTQGDIGGSGGSGGSGGTGVVGGSAGSGGTGASGGQGNGGALFSSTLSLFTVTNSTLEQNSTTAGFGGPGGGAGTAAAGGTAGSTGAKATDGFARGGGLFHTGTGTVTLVNDTISRNVLSKTAGSLLGSGGGIFNEAGTASVLNTLVALNTADAGMTITGPQVSGTFTSQGSNLITDATGSTGFTAVGDLTGTTANPLDAKLGLLASNGGPTKTVKLLAGSIAINAGKTTGSPTTDQRGFTRPLGGKVDIGAVEVS